MRAVVVAGLVLALAACSKSAPETPTTPTPPTGQNPPTPQPGPPAGPPTISITSSGLSPADITITVGSRVTFVNSDTRAHDMLGGVDHNNRSCFEVDTAGFLVPGQRRETEALITPGVCPFHDHTQLGNPAYQGRIHVIP